MPHADNEIIPTSIDNSAHICTGFKHVLSGCMYAMMYSGNCVCG